jgi:hypothetical protein
VLTAEERAGLAGPQIAARLRRRRLDAVEAVKREATPQQAP